MNALLAKLKTLATKGWKSKTVLLGYLTMALSGAQQVLSQFQVVLKPSTYAMIGAVIGALIVVVRLFTNQGLENK